MTRENGSEHDVARFLFFCGLVKPARLKMLPNVLAAGHTTPGCSISSLALSLRTPGRMLGPKHEDGVLDRLERRVGAAMGATAAIHESFRPRLVIAIDPAVARWAGDSILTAQVRYRHLLFLITRQKLQTLIQDPTLFPGHTTSSCVPKYRGTVAVALRCKPCLRSVL